MRTAATPLVRHVFENPASPEQIRAFQDWEKRNAARMQVRYADFPVANAFGLRSSDVVTLDDSMTFDFSGTEPRLLDAAGRHLGTLANTPVELLRRFLAELDGRHSLAFICSQPPFADHARNLQGLVGALLGGPFLLPAGISALERELPAVALLRFPNQSPYAMPREYWENSIAVRQALGAFYARVDDFRAFADGLRGLHRLATIGASGTHYYGGAGGVATVPGEFRNMPIGNRFDERRKWLHQHWLGLLAVPNTLVESGSIVSANGVPLVEITDGGHVCHHPYGHRGELLARQLNEIRVHLAAALSASGPERELLVRHCALFHHAFAHAHPFANINNSIAMNIVNDLLGRAGVGVLPHLYFDQVALFLQPQDYVRFFARAFQAHVINDEAGRNREATTALIEGVASTAGG